MARILILTKYGDLAASTRHRFLQYRPWLEDAGIEVHIECLLPNEYLESKYKGLKVNLRKIIHSLKYKKESVRSFFVILEADGGLPIKRFVEGINVDPSIGKILDTKCSCRQFDINQILP